MLRSTEKKAEKLDAFGQLQPGAFERAALLERYLLQHDDYRTLAQMYEWKTASEPLERAQAGAAGPCVTQKLLVRREFGNWEQAHVNLELQETTLGKRWAVTSIYRHDHDPRVARGDGEPDADPEESRNC